MSLSFSDAAKTKIDWLLTRYPTKMAATLPVLWIAQYEFGHISDEAMHLVATTLDVPPAHVFGVMTFYTMYYKSEPPTFHVQVCTNISCMLNGAYETFDKFKQALGVDAKQATGDGMFMVEEVECLAACDKAPCVQINDKYFEPVFDKDVDELLSRLRSDGAGVRPNEAKPIG